MGSPAAITVLLADLEAGLRPLVVDVSRAWWDANVRSDEATRRRHEEAELRLRSALGDGEAFARVTAALADSPSGRREGRVLDVVRRMMEPNQVPEALRRRLVELETRVEAVYNNHRGEIDGRRVDDNDIARVLTGSDDPVLRQKAWEASKSVGAAVEGPVLELVEMRNEAARSLGHPDHYALALALGELSEDRLAATLDEVERLTEAPFGAWKAELDAARADRFGCAVDELRPWHYDDPFFQDAPAAEAVDLDAHFADADLVALTLRTYDGMGLDLRPVLDGSDLYAREGKSQHAFCVDVDREGDVRVLANVVPNERWVETMLHEFGHAAYDRNIGRDLPFLLRAPAHMLTTEAVAMLLGRLVRDGEWLVRVGGLEGAGDDGVAAALAGRRRAALLVFVRWALVVVHFERGLYRDPGADHSARWWDLVERFQLVRRPDGRTGPDWAAKVHLAVAPVYYQNYLYGELMASQLGAALARDAGGIVDRPAAGRWLVERVFRLGAAERWDHLLAHATGAGLDPRWLAAELAG